MVNVDEAIIARLKSHGHDFEVLVDCEKAIKLRQGGEVDIRDVLAAEKIFSDAKKGMLASSGAMKQVFQTEDPLEVAKKVIKSGEIQLTADYKNKLRAERRKQIIDLIHRKGVDPRTGAPHPPSRIEGAFEEARVHIDEFKSAQSQIEPVLKKIRPILPIRFETRRIAIRIPAVYAGKSYGAVKHSSKILKEEWQSNGDLVVMVEIPAGLQEEFFNRLNDLTKGEIETKIVEIKGE